MKHHHISPVPDGWLVRCQRNGVLRQRHVAKGAGLVGALAARDAILAEAGPASPKAHPICHSKARSNTGFAGVSYSVKVKGTGGAKYETVQATVRAERRKVVSKCFAVAAHGYDEAVRAAVAWREQVLSDRRAGLATQRRK